MSALTARLMNVALDLATAEPVMEGVRHVTAWRARLRKAARDVVHVRLEQLGVATRVDLALVEAELARASLAAEDLAAALHALEKKLP